MKVKVLHVIFTSKFSGAENVACQIINYFRDTNEVELAYCSLSGPIELTLKEKQIDYYPIEAANMKELKRVINEYNPDIIHAHDFMASVLSSIVKGHRKLISHLHCNPPWLQKINKKSLFYGIFSLRFDEIFTVSDSIRKEYIFSNFIEKKVTVVGNPINQAIKQLRDKMEKDVIEGQHDVVFIGRLTKEKNPLRYIRLIASLKKMGNINAALVGDGDLYRECIQEIENLGLKDEIKVYGFLDNPYSVLTNSKILCVTSEWEGYGLVVTEAFTFSKPVVCTPVGGLTMLVNDECGKVCLTDDDFVNEIYKLLHEEQYLKKKSENALRQLDLLEQKFNYNKFISDTYYKLVRK